MMNSSPSVITATYSVLASTPVMMFFQDLPEEMSFRLKLLIAIVGILLSEIVIISLFFFLFNKLLVSRWSYAPRDASSLALSLTAFFSLALIVIVVLYLEMLPLFVWYVATGALSFLWLIHFLFTFLLRRNK